MLTVTASRKHEGDGCRAVLISISVTAPDTDPAFLVLTKNSVTAESSGYSDAELTSIASVEDMLTLPVTACYPGPYRSATAQLVFPDEATETQSLNTLTADLTAAVASFRTLGTAEEVWTVTNSCTGSSPVCAQTLRRWLDRKQLTIPENKEMPRYILGILSAHSRPFQEKPVPALPDDPLTRGPTE